MQTKLTQTNSIMQTNFQDRQAQLITEAIETIQLAVKANGKVIPYPDSGLWFNHIGYIYVRDEEGNTSEIRDLDSYTIAKLADYCLNYNPTTNNAN
jgi:hypothetical protein